MSATAIAPRSQPSIVADGLVTVDEAADFLRISRSSVYNMMAVGLLPSVRIPGVKSRRIPLAALRSVAAEGLACSVPQSAAS